MADNPNNEPEDKDDSSCIDHQVIHVDTKTGDTITGTQKPEH